MWGFAESTPKKPMEMEFRKAGRACCLLEQNTGLIFVGQELASATQPTESVVMEQVPHEEIILPF
jgi:hypothetical protein